MNTGVTDDDHGQANSVGVKRYTVHQSGATPVGIEANVLRRVDVLRKKRHLSDYIRAGAVSQQEADEAIALAERLCAEITIWLREQYADLME